MALTKRDSLHVQSFLIVDGDGNTGIISEGGKVLLKNLPTSDPGVAGQLWNSSATFKVSAGQEI